MNFQFSHNQPKLIYDDAKNYLDTIADEIEIEQIVNSEFYPESMEPGQIAVLHGVEADCPDQINLIVFFTNYKNEVLSYRFGFDPVKANNTLHERRLLILFYALIGLISTIDFESFGELLGQAHTHYNEIAKKYGYPHLEFNLWKEAQKMLITFSEN